MGRVGIRRDMAGSDVIWRWRDNAGCIWFWQLLKGNLSGLARGVAQMPEFKR